MSQATTLRSFVRDVPDFPKPGILFRDIAPLLREQLPATVAAMQGLYSPAEWAGVDVIGGIEARGFILGAALALAAGKGFVPLRKAGKLPGPLVARSYGLEYGKDTLELQHGTGRMLIVDDVLATGGTLEAAAELASEAGYIVAGFACLINLSFLNQFRWRDFTARAVLEY
ncbi:MAG: adenine phosphoribosyltransferase [Rickettsiales bacterium]